MEKKKRAKNNASRILRLLKEIGPTRYTEISAILKTSGSAVSYALNNKLLPDKFVERLQNRKYAITTTGQLFLQFDQLNRFMENEANPSYEEKLQITSITENLGPFLEKRRAVPVRIALIGSADLNSTKAFDAIRSELSYLPSLLLHRFAYVVGRQRGLDQPGLESHSPHYDNLRWMKDAYDFDATLILSLNPRRLVRSLNWDNIFEESKKKDESFLRGIQIADQKIQEDKEKFLLNFVIKELEYRSERTKEYLSHATDGSTDALLCFSSDELAERLSGMIERMLKSLSLKMSKTEREVILNASLKKNFRIAAKTIFMIEKRD